MLNTPAEYDKDTLPAKLMGISLPASLLGVSAGICQRELWWMNQE
jgi:hypothetical protein